MTAPQLPLAGGCQCGACRFEIAAPPLFAYMCHCTECRKQTSSAFAASILAASDTVTLTGPVKSWFRNNDNGPPLEGLFCSECGTRLMNHYVPRSDRVRVRAGTLDDLSWFKPAAEFFVSRRLDFLPQLAEVQCERDKGDSAAMFAAWRRLFTK